MNKKAREVFLSLHHQLPPIFRNFPGYVLSVCSREQFDEISKKIPFREKWDLFFSLLKSSALNLASPWEMHHLSGEEKIWGGSIRNSLRNVGGVPVWLLISEKDSYQSSRLQIFDGFNVVAEDRWHKVCWLKSSRREDAIKWICSEKGREHFRYAYCTDSISKGYSIGIVQRRLNQEGMIQLPQTFSQLLGVDFFCLNGEDYLMAIERRDACSAVWLGKWDRDRLTLEDFSLIEHLPVLQEVKQTEIFFHSTRVDLVLVGQARMTFSYHAFYLRDLMGKVREEDSLCTFPSLTSTSDELAGPGMIVLQGECLWFKQSQHAGEEGPYAMCNKEDKVVYRFPACMKISKKYVALNDQVYLLGQHTRNGGVTVYAIKEEQVDVISTFACNVKKSAKIGWFWNELLQSKVPLVAYEIKEESGRSLGVWTIDGKRGKIAQFAEEDRGRWQLLSGNIPRIFLESGKETFVMFPHAYVEPTFYN